MHSGDYQNVFKYVSPPFNPGVRRWCGVNPERAVVDFPYQSALNFQTSVEFPSCSPDDLRVGRPPFGCGYPTPYSPPTGGERIEGFGDSNLFLNIIVIAIIVYLIYYLATKK